MEAIIREDASEIFAKKRNRELRPDVPWSKGYEDFYKTLKELQGKKLKVRRTYDHRVFLEYKKPEEGNVVGIDMDKDLVIFVKDGKKLKDVV